MKQRMHTRGDGHCKCYETFSKKVEEMTGDPQASIDFAMVIEGSAAVVYPRLHYTYRKKKKDVFMLKTTEGTIIPTFCPFCGKRYNKKEKRNEASKDRQKSA